ncbi:MFS transporter [Chloroflexota bacterium]
MPDRTQANPVLMGVTLSSGIFALLTYVGLIAALLVEMSDDFGTTVAVMGQLTTITGVSWAVLAPLIGPWSDRIGRKRVLAIGMVIFCISMVGYSLSNAFWALIIVSVVAGVGGAMVAPSVLASVADYYSAHTYGQAMAAVNIASPLGYLVGVPVAVLIAGSFGWRWSFLSLSAFTLVCFLAVVIVMPSIKSQQLDRKLTYISRFSEALREKTLMPMVIANTILQCAYWVVATYMAAYLIQSYALSTSQLAPLIASIAVGQLIGTLAGGQLADKFDKIKICAVGSLLLGVTGLAFILLVGNVWLSVFWGGLFMGFYGGSRPAYFALMALVSKTMRGTVMGIQAVSNHLGRALGAAVGGLVLGIMGYDYLGALCLILGLLAFGIYVFLKFLFKDREGS